MDKNILLFLATLVGIGILHKFSFIISLFIFALLVYYCTSQHIVGNVNQDINNSDTKLYTRYILKLTEISKYILFSLKWSTILRTVTETFIILKNFGKSNIYSDNRNSGDIYSNERSKNERYKYCGESPLIKSEFDTVVECILRDYVKPWYQQKISENPEFLNEARGVILKTFNNLSCKIEKTDLRKLLVKILQAYRHFFFHFKNGVSQLEDNDSILQSCLNKKEEIFNLVEMNHWVVMNEANEWCYLQSVSSTLIKSFGPRDTQSCHVLHLLLTEILSHNVMFPLVKVLTDPNKLNTWMMKCFQNVFKIDFQIYQAKMSGSADEEVHVLAKQIKENQHVQVMLNTENSPNHEKILLNEMNSASNVVQSQSIDNSLGNESMSFVHGKNISSECANENSVFESSTFSKKSSLSAGSFDQSSSCHVNKYHNLFLPEATQMKRSKSEDYIRNVIPFSSSSFRSNRTYSSNTLPAKTKMSELRNLNETIFFDRSGDRNIPNLFENIKITNTLLKEDIGHNPYILYCVEYKGLFQDVSTNAPELIQEVVEIKRRFREFDALHSRLESKPLVKPFLKDIKRPNKKMTTPFANLDEKHISERKKELETYLQELCKRPVIAQTPDLQEFLAYGSDASIAFVETPKLSQVLNYTVKSAKELLRGSVSWITKPVFQSPIYSTAQKILSEIQPAQDERDSSDYLLEYTTKNSQMNYEIEKFCSKFTTLCQSAETSDLAKTYNTQCSVMTEDMTEEECKGCNCSDMLLPFPENNAGNENCIAHVVLDILCEAVLYKTSKETPHIENICKIIPVNEISNILEERLKKNMDHIKIIAWLHSLHQSIWPEQRGAPKNIDPKLPVFLCDYLKGKFESNVILSLVLKKILGPHDLTNIIELLIGSLQNEKLNKSVLFYVLDTVIGVLCDKNR